MKLAKLLGAGKSFFGGQGSVSYRENKHVYLPKFNEANPFLKPKAVEAEVLAPVAVVTPVVAAVKVPQGAAKVAAKTQKISTVPAPRPVRKAGWADKLNPFRAPQSEVSPVVAAVQPELSLDAVKVLHNDLSDADVEVVPVKSRTVMAAVAVPSDYMGEPALRAN